MTKRRYHVHLTRPNELAQIKRKAYARDPVARALLEVCPPELPGFGIALAETLKLRSYGIPITPELVRKVGERYAKNAPPQQLGIPDESHLDVVYYARIGNRVKIGTTRNLHNRMADITPEELLVVEPGGFQLESARHLEFRHLRTHGEWFRYQGLLTFHVQKMREAAKPELVDTAALAVHLGCSPAYVRRLVALGMIAPLGTAPVGRTGRPSLAFDLEASDLEYRQYRAKLDHAERGVRKSP